MFDPKQKRWQMIAADTPKLRPLLEELIEHLGEEYFETIFLWIMEQTSVKKLPFEETKQKLVDGYRPTVLELTCYVCSKKTRTTKSRKVPSHHYDCGICISCHTQSMIESEKAIAHLINRAKFILKETSNEAFEAFEALPFFQQKTIAISQEKNL